MPRTIARVVHDIKPPIETINAVAALLEEMAEHLPGDTELSQQFRQGLGKLSSLSTTVEQYINELDAEAKREGIQK